MTNMSGLGAELSMKHLYHERYGFGTAYIRLLTGVMNPQR